MAHHTHTIGSCLQDLGITQDNATIFDACETLEEEFKVLKKLFNKLALEHHPDKGGDAESFRKIRAAFDTLKELKISGGIELYSTHLQDSASCNSAYEQHFQQAGTGHTPSYEYYEQAAQEEMPSYKVELAKSNRSACSKCKPKKKADLNAMKENLKAQQAKNTEEEEEEEEEVTETALVVERRTTRSGRRASNSNNNKKKPKAKSLAELGLYNLDFYIPKDTIRVGSLDEDAGSYGRWHHLACWRVPYRFWAGLTDPTDAKQVHLDLISMEGILLDNYSSLPKESQEALVEHIMDQDHWAKQTAASKPPPNLKKVPQETSPAAEGNKENKASASPDKKRSAEEVAASLVPSDGAIVKKTKLTFVVPRPDMENALANCYQGKRFVLTGVFPEIGGGGGLDMGKGRVKEMIEAFGGRVTGSVSGVTNYLVVGKSPGLSKVTKANDKNIPLIDLHALRGFIMGDIPALEQAPPPAIAEFSAGYNGNGLALIENGGFQQPTKLE